MTREPDGVFRCRKSKVKQEVSLHDTINGSTNGLKRARNEKCVLKLRSNQNHHNLTLRCIQRHLLLQKPEKAAENLPVFLLHPFILHCHPALLLSDFFFSCSSCTETCLKPDIVCQPPSAVMDSTSLCSLWGPTLHVSCQTLTSPGWDSSFALSFLIYLFLPHPSTSSPPFTLWSHEPVLRHHRTVS